MYRARLAAPAESDGHGVTRAITLKRNEAPVTPIVFVSQAANRQQTVAGSEGVLVGLAPGRAGITRINREDVPGPVEGQA